MESSGFPNQPVSNRHSTSSGFQLIIERGISKFPVRPVIGDRFLIGAGSNCQLQLAGDIPLLHSIIIPEAGHLWIDAVSPTPLLFINGQPLRDGELNRGDVISIGDFVFCVDHQRPAQQPAASPQPAADCSPAALTATELVELLERDLKELNRFDQDRRKSLAALAQTASLHNVAPDVAPQIDWSKDPRASLLQLLSQLHDRSRALDLREVALADHAEKLADSQEALRRQLELLTSQHKNAAPSGAEAEHRKSA